MKKSQTAALALALVGVAATAQAGVKLSAVRATTVTVTGPKAYLPLNDAGATTLTFNLASAGKKVLTFSFKCGTTEGELDLDIIVNDVAVPATAAYEPLCSPSYQYTPWTRPSITVAINGIKGSNTVKILAIAGRAYVAHSSLVIHD